MRWLSKAEALVELESQRQQLNGKLRDCAMCALAHPGLESGQAALEPLVQTEQAVVVLNRFAQRRGHLLVISRQHIETVPEMNWALYQHLEGLVYLARSALHQAFTPLQVYTGTFGATAPVPMSFSHYHTHVVPVYEADERARPARVFSWSEGVFLYDDAEAATLRRQILASWPRLP